MNSQNKSQTLPFKMKIWYKSYSMFRIIAIKHIINQEKTFPSSDLFQILADLTPNIIQVKRSRLGNERMQSGQSRILSDICKTCFCKSETWPVWWHLTTHSETRIGHIYLYSISQKHFPFRTEWKNLQEIGWGQFVGMILNASQVLGNVWERKMSWGKSFD